MTMERRLFRWCWYLLAASLFVVPLFINTPEEPKGATAAPHLISPKKHPYDPDWPEVQLILSIKCSECHSPESKNTDFSSYDALMKSRATDGTAVVVPNKPEKSLLFEYIDWNVHARKNSQRSDEPLMPENRFEWLTAGQIQTVKRWIKNGALEYKLPKTCNTHRPLLEMDFPSARQCKICHPGQYEQWSRSMHAYSQHSPAFEAFNLTLIERTSGTLGTFCSRCHTPLGTALGENGSRRNVHRSRLSMEGVTCIVCHRPQNNKYKSNGRLAIQPGKMADACVFGPFQDSIKPNKDVHPSKRSKHLTSSAFCGTCHDVVNPQGVRLEEAYSEWQNSPAAKQGITCQDCHMGPNPGVAVAREKRPLGRAAVVPGVDPKYIPLRRLSNHSFVGPDYSMLPDTEFPYKLDWMYEKDYRDTKNLTRHQQSTLRDLRRKNRKQLKIAAAQRYQLLKNAAKIKVTHPRTARCGGKLPVRVDVRSTTAGHNFPTGFTAERQAWVEIVVKDPSGRIVFVSGDLDKNGDLRDSTSHAVMKGTIKKDRYLMSFQNRFASLTNKGTDRTVILSVNRHLAPLSILRPSTEVSLAHGRSSTFRIAKTSIPPLKTIGRIYPVRLPKIRGIYQLHVRLNYRHLPPDLLDEIGIPHLKKQLEIVVIDQYRTKIEVK